MKPERPAFLDNTRAGSIIRRLNLLSYDTYGSTILSVGAVINFVLQDANVLGVFNAGADIVAAVLARAIVSFISFDNDEAVVLFVGKIAQFILQFRRADPRLLGHEGGRA